MPPEQWPLQHAASVSHEAPGALQTKPPQVFVDGSQEPAPLQQSSSLAQLVPLLAQHVRLFPTPSQLANPLVPPQHASETVHDAPRATHRSGVSKQWRA
jgi:hypothetical protein